MPIRTLATDYDGTIATHGTVDADTLAALRRLRDAGGTLILVTGRELPQLKQVFPDLVLCHMVVAENGALLYTPDTGKERPLCDPPEESFVRALKQRGVTVTDPNVRPDDSSVANATDPAGIRIEMFELGPGSPAGKAIASWK